MSRRWLAVGGWPLVAGRWWLAVGGWQIGPNMIALIEEHRAEIAALCRQYGVERLEVFGSAATGAFDAATSDIDFIARFGPHDRLNLFERFFGLSEALEQLLKHSIDLLTDQPIRNPYFAQTVQASRQTIYDSARKEIPL